MPDKKPPENEPTPIVDLLQSMGADSKSRGSQIAMDVYQNFTIPAALAPNWKSEDLNM